jgi:hypothetical protein
MEAISLQDPAGAQKAPAVLLTLGTDHCGLIFSRLAVEHLICLRSTCSTAKRIVDVLGIWKEVLDEMNKINRYNVCPFDKMPFVWLPEDERDENYQKRLDKFKGWSATDPRISQSWVSLSSFGKCAELYVFSMKTVGRIQAHLQILDMHEEGADEVPWPGSEPPSVLDFPLAVCVTTLDRHEEGADEVPWPGSEPPSVLDFPTAVRDTTLERIEDLRDTARFWAFFRLAQLNTAMEDLCRDSGPRWYRDDGDPSSAVVIKEARGPSLVKAIKRYYCCGENRQHRWSGDDWGTDDHLHYLAWNRAASMKLKDLLGSRLCERIEVLGEARRNFLFIMDSIHEQFGTIHHIYWPGRNYDDGVW